MAQNRQLYTADWELILSTTVAFCPLDWTLSGKSKELTTQGVTVDVSPNINTCQLFNKFFNDLEL